MAAERGPEVAEGTRSGFAARRDPRGASTAIPAQRALTWKENNPV